MRVGTHLINPHLYRRLLRLIAHCIPILLLITLPAAYSANIYLPTRIIVLQSAHGGPYADFTEQFRQALQTHGDLLKSRVTNLQLENASQQLSTLSPNDLVITVGTRATSNVLASDTRAAILSVLVPRLTAQRLAKQITGHRHKITTIYLDQPPTRYLQLARIIMPKSGKLGVILGPATKTDKSQLNRAAQQMHMNLVFAEMEPGKRNPLGALQRIIRDCDALLALPDPLVYNRFSLPPILLTTFRYRVPVIGFSPAFVNAGAVTGVYSTPKQIGQQAAEMVLDGKLSGGGHYPIYFNVRFNSTVAQALDMSLPSAGDAEKLLQTLDGSP